MIKGNGALVRSTRQAVLLASFCLPLSAFAQTTPSRQQVDPTPPPSSVNQPASDVNVDGGKLDETSACPLSDSTLSVTLNKIAFEAPGGGAVPPALAAILAGVQLPATGMQPIAAVCSSVPPARCA